MAHKVSSRPPHVSGHPTGLKYLSTNDSIFSDPLHKLDSGIRVFHHVVTTSPRAGPIRIHYIQALVSALAERYNLLKQGGSLRALT